MTERMSVDFPDPLVPRILIIISNYLKLRDQFDQVRDELVSGVDESLVPV
jgi:hypothetical protein